MSTIIESQPIFHGPLQSSRWGHVLTLDLTAPQAQMVVERGSVLPRASVIVTGAATRLITHSKAGDKLQHIVVMGSTGDPSEHPDLKEITENLRTLRDKWFSRAKLVLLTQLTGEDSYGLRTTIGMYDKLITRYAWGTAKTFSSITGEKTTRLADLTKHLTFFENAIVEAQFGKGSGDNSTDAEVKSWIKKLQEVQPKEVHIISGTSHFTGKKPRAITPKRTQQIVDEITEKTGLAVHLHEEEQLLR